MGKCIVPTTSSSLVVYGLLGTPVQGISPANFNFGALTTGTTTQTTFVVTNTGAGELIGTVATAAPFAIVSGASYALAGGGSSNVVVNFTPPSVGSFTGTVVFASNVGNSTNVVTGQRRGFSGRVIQRKLRHGRGAVNGHVHRHFDRYDHQPVLDFRGWGQLQPHPHHRGPYLQRHRDRYGPLDRQRPVGEQHQHAGQFSCGHESAAVAGQPLHKEFRHRRHWPDQQPAFLRDQHRWSDADRLGNCARRAVLRHRRQSI